MSEEYQSNYCRTTREKINADIKKILVLYTGGTIGMKKNIDGAYAPSSNIFTMKIKSMPEMHDEFHAKKIFEDDVPEDVIVMPHIESRQFHIIYYIKEYHPLLDSSNMSPKDWKIIAKDIGDTYNNYDGFVVLHGTDTLAYTASALSFMLENLGKTVVITGSQIPIFELRSDAKDNFLSSLVFAASYNIPEVCVCFGNRLLRGNRTVKSSSNFLKAFSSPNYSKLGKVRINFEIKQQYFLSYDKCKPFKVFLNINPNIGLITLFPTVTGQMLSAFLSPPIQGAVLQSYGIGNIPTHNTDFVNALIEALSRGVIIVNVTQCNQGTVNTTYETGKVLTKIGIIPGYDMTAEAALSKLLYVLGHTKLTLDEKRQMIQQNLRGEITLPEISN